MAPARAARSGRFLTVGFLTGVVLMIVLGVVAGLAALGEFAPHPTEPGGPFESTLRSDPAGGVDPV